MRLISEKDAARVGRASFARKLLILLLELFQGFPSALSKFM